VEVRSEKETLTEREREREEGKGGREVGGREGGREWACLPSVEARSLRSYDPPHEMSSRKAMVSSCIWIHSAIHE